MSYEASLEAGQVQVQFIPVVLTEWRRPLIHFIQPRVPKSLHARMVLVSLGLSRVIKSTTVRMLLMSPRSVVSVNGMRVTVVRLVLCVIH